MRRDMAAAYGGSVVAMAAAAAPTSSARCNLHSALVGFQSPPSSSSSSLNSVRLPSLAPLLSQCRWPSSSRTSREEQQSIVGKRSWVLFNKARCTETSRVVAAPAIVCLQSGSQNEESKERRERVVEGEQQQQQQDTSVRFDVSSNCVNPSFRVSPFLQRSVDQASDSKLRILFLSEGNVCRSIFAEAIFSHLIQDQDLQDSVECTSKASKDYNVGEAPDARAVEVAQELGLQLREGAVARVFDCTSDIVLFDLLLVMDKFNASDVLKEVTVYEAIDKEGRYSYKVRRLGEFCRKRMVEDIDDPLYGNMGGPEELELLREVYQDLQDSCEGLLQFLMETKTSLQGSETLKQGIARTLGQMESLDWLVPPMLQRA
ncbi:hypothetical protein CY35_11G062000 [Sphagnum magellanicum]|nr:hypothetical protein CY35_11G062000 [Sphagnum magellanicum]